MKTTLLALPFLLAIAFVVYAEGKLTPFAIWNALPAVAGFALLWVGRHARLTAYRIGCAIFAVVATLFVTLFHLAWWLDWHGTATGSSTSALAFIFVPIWACLLASIAGALAWGIAWLVDRHRLTR
jgi:uncharacterized membrane protein YfbV (UPF0208 family)